MEPTAPAPPAGVQGYRRQVDEALRWTVRSLAEEVRDVEGGWVARSRSLHLVHSLNRLQVTSTMDPHEVVDLAEEHLSDLPYRHVEVDDERTAVALERELVTPSAGWRVDREVFMVLEELSPPSGATDEPQGARHGAMPGALVRLSAEEADQLMRRWLAEEGFDTAPGTLDQLSESNRREGELWSEEVLGVRDAGAAVALTKARAHGGIGWVEDVYTVPEARRRGYARLLVGRAVAIARAADHALTFIIADDNDWPKHLYAELGFRPIGCTWTFHRDLTS